MKWRKVVAVILGICIGFAGIYGAAYYQEKARLNPVMARYKKELDATKAEFDKAVEKIQKEIADGQITQKEGAALMQHELKKALQKNQDVLQKTMDAIVKN